VRTQAGRLFRLVLGGQFSLPLPFIDVVNLVIVREFEFGWEWPPDSFLGILPSGFN